MSDRAPVLRSPAHRVSPRARTAWRIGALVQVAVGLAVLLVLWLVAGVLPWAPLWLVAYVAVAAAYVVLMPNLRYATHRWEATPTAIYAQRGWLGRVRDIAPMSRVQTVEFHQGAIQRSLGLASVKVSTAAGDLELALLDAATAEDLSQQLTAAAEAEPGDAT